MRPAKRSMLKPQNGWVRTSIVPSAYSRLGRYVKITPILKMFWSWLSMGCACHGRISTLMIPTFSVVMLNCKGLQFLYLSQSAES
jgi:hypothetical protein